MTSDGPDPHDAGSVQVNDIHLYYENQGTGAPLVCIGGLGADISEWQPIIGGLARHFRVLAFDNRGAGRSDKPDQPYTIDQMAGDTAGLMRVLGIERAHVLGISLGGRIALALALAHPERVAKLVLVSTSARVSQRPWWFGLAGIASGLPIFQSTYPQPRYAFRHQRDASTGFDRTARLSEIRAPTLILHGIRDKTVPFARAEELHAGISGSQLIPFDGGHLFMLFRERQRFLDTVAAFLQA